MEKKIKQVISRLINLMFGFPENEWNNIDVPYTSLKKFSNFASWLTIIVFIFVLINVITFKVPHGICGKNL